MTQQDLVEKFNLRSRLKFDIEGGHIWLDENRMLLYHSSAMQALRAELFESLGRERARGLLVRMGFASGLKDAELAHNLVPDAPPEELLKFGPMLHTFEGMVKSGQEDLEFDTDTGHFTVRAAWHNSWEAQSHVQSFGVSDGPECWSLIGYASGYVTGLFNQFIVFREVQCEGCGDEHCLIVGQRAEDYDADDGYLDYFKPDDIEGQMEVLKDEVSRLKDSLIYRSDPDDLIGNSTAFRTAFDLLSKAASSQISVLLLGETGVGKEVFARWLHDHSDRASKPFVAVNCGAIPHELIESELFGTQKGAYTGADQSRPGRFERADGGTLFLDEVGELSLAAQVKLLRVLQTGEVERLGDDKTRKVDVRLVAATNVILKQAIAEGTFRADLYYRLATFPVQIPPLRERMGDVPLLAASLVKKYENDYGKKLQGLSDMAAKALSAYEWPGNVRELENVIERGVLLATEGRQIEVEHLFAGAGPSIDGAELDQSGALCDQDQAEHTKLCETLLREGLDLKAHEAALIRMAVDKADGNLTRAAKTLGLTRRQLAYRLKQQEG